MKRRLFIATSLTAALGGCAQIGTALNQNNAFHSALESAEALNERAIGTRGLARTYRPRDVSADFPVNSLPTPSSAEYARMMGDGFRSYRLVVDGAVDAPQVLTLDALRRMMQKTQITRHDCVEGWSAIAQWDGVRLADVLALAKPRDDARFIVFRSFDADAQGSPYYESLSLEQAAHPQTLLALRQNGAPITPDRGAPVRLRVPTQLGYKSAKWVHRIDVLPSVDALYGGKGGYWEDQGYEWYAGI